MGDDGDFREKVKYETPTDADINNYEDTKKNVKTK